MSEELPVSEALKQAGEALASAEKFQENVRKAHADVHSVLTRNGFTAGASADEFVSVMSDDPSKMASVLQSLIDTMRVDDSQQGKSVASKSASKHSYLY